MPHHPFRGRLIPAQEAQTTTDTYEEPTLLQFDSGRRITFQDGNHHTAIFGTTGSGKTASAIIPMLDRLIAEGLPGFISDIKGNLLGKVKALAKARGRADDILEIGTGPNTTPLNLLSGLTEGQTQTLLETLSMRTSMQRSENIIWYLAGIRDTCQIVAMLRFLCQLDKRFDPTMSNLLAIVSDLNLASELYKFFLSQAQSQQATSLAKIISSNHFHPCKHDEMQSNDFSRDYTSYLEQVNWRIKAIKEALEAFHAAPGLEHGLARPGADMIDMAKWIYKENKIVVLRFGPESGSIGATVSRFCIESLYRAVFRHGLKQSRYTFLVADEFQETANLTDANPYNDVRFLARSREFNNISIYAAQSLASLKGQADLSSITQAEAFLNNCNNRIFFRCDDPMTHSAAKRHEKDIDLPWLGPGQAFVTRCVSSQRIQECGLETLDNPYKAGQAALAAGLYTQSPNDDFPDCHESIPLNEIICELREAIKSLQERNLKETMEDVKTEVANTSMTFLKYRQLQRHTSSKPEDKPATPAKSPNSEELIRLQKLYEDIRSQSNNFTSDYNYTSPTESAEKPKGQKAERKYLKYLNSRKLTTEEAAELHTSLAIAAQRRDLKNPVTFYINQSTINDELKYQAQLAQKHPSLSDEVPHISVRKDKFFGDWDPPPDISINPWWNPDTPETMKSIKDTRGYVLARMGLPGLDPNSLPKSIRKRLRRGLAAIETALRGLMSKTEEQQAIQP